MKRNMFLVHFALALFLFGIGFEAHGQSNAGDCLQFGIFDDGDGNILWFDDYYPDQTNCSDSTVEDCYVWAPENMPAPMVCGNCPLIGNAARADKKTDESNPAAQAGHRLRQPVPVNHQLKNTLPARINSYVSKKSWIPANCVSVSKVHWVMVETAGDPVPVKLYVVDLDFSAGLPATDYLFQKRTLRVGFEIASIPKNVDLQTVPLVAARKSPRVAKDCQTEAMVSIDEDLKPFRILTASDLVLTP